VAQQALANVRTVIAFGGERQESERYAQRIEQHYQLNVRQLYMTGVYYMAVSTFLMNTIVQGLLLYLGTRMIQSHRLTPDILLAFMLYQGQLQSETLNLFQSYTSLLKSSGAGDKVFELLDRQPPPPSIRNEQVRANEDYTEEEEEDETDENNAAEGTNHNGFVTSVRSSGASRSGDRQLVATADASSSSRPSHIKFSNVSFSYPTRPNSRVLHQLNLSIQHGETLALVGRSGAGKSTIIHLLQRFYDPNAGTIFINGVDLRQLDLLQHRRQIGVVTQDPVLFEGTLLDNLKYGHVQVSFDDVQEAARLAHADEFIQSFPAAYETQVGERGAQLSGGQK